MKKILALFTAISLTLSSQVQAKDYEQNFRNAKVNMVKIFKQLDKPTTLYCGCAIEFPNKGYKPNLESCGYRIRKNEKRAQRIEAEHIMSAWEFGHAKDCWKTEGRKGCELNDNGFAVMEGDLHNLYPAIGEVNGDRSNYQFAQNVRAPRHYGQCEMLIDSRRHRANPPQRARGIVARAYKYMAQRYNIKLDAEHINLFNQWDNQYRPDKNECKRNQLIAKIQGNDNPFVSAKCKKANY